MAEAEGESRAEEETGEEREDAVAEAEGEPTTANKKSKKKKKKKTQKQQQPQARDGEEVEVETERQVVIGNVDGPAAANSKSATKGKAGRDGAHAQARSSPLPSQPLVNAHFGWQAVVKPKKGRCAVASRSFKAGDIVLAESAVMFVPRDTFSEAVCHNCCCAFIDPTDTPPACTTCKFTIFCQTCSKVEAVQRSHKAWCPLLSAMPGISSAADCSPDLLRLVLYLARAKAQSSTGELQGHFDSARRVLHSTIQDAMHLSSSQLLSQPGWRTAIHRGCAALLEEAEKLKGGQPGDGDPGEDPLAAMGSVGDLQRWAALLSNNVHGMGALGPHNTDTALGLFPFVSLLNHSCRPNCIFVSHGTTMFVTAAQDISAGAELCVSYINAYEPRRERQQQLLESKHFLCRCERCAEPMSVSLDRFLEGVLCQYKGCQGTLYRDNPEPSSNSGPSRRQEQVQQKEEQEETENWTCDTCLRRIGRRGRASDGGQEALEGPGRMDGHGGEEVREVDGEASGEGVAATSAAAAAAAPSAAEACGSSGPDTKAGASVPGLATNAHTNGSVDPEGGRPQKAHGRRGGKKGKVGSYSQGQGAQQGDQTKGVSLAPPWEVEAAARRRLGEGLELYQSRQRPEALALLGSFLEEFGKKLHPLHSLLLDARTPLMNCARGMGDLEGAIVHCRAVAAALAAVTPWEVRELANFWAVLGEMHTMEAEEAQRRGGATGALERRARKQAKEAMQKAEALRTTFLQVKDS